MTELISPAAAVPAPAAAAEANAAQATGTLDPNWKFFFDLRGWILVPAVLPPEQAAAVRAHLLGGGTAFTGPAQELLDHPIVVEVLTHILARGKVEPDACWFRCENAFPTIRSYDWTSTSTNVPHVVLDARTGGPMSYQCKNGMISSGLTRVVWELNPVRAGMGGTQFLSGTHKAEFPFPAQLRVPDNRHLESYSCPAGSLFIFSESLLHAATRWIDREHQRVAIFAAYNSLWAQWHRLNLDPAIVATMPLRRRSLFRGTYANDFDPNSPTAGGNRAYSELNRCL